MNPLATPLLFTPVDKAYIWGTESWAIAAHPDGDSVIAQGDFAGRTLSCLTAQFGTALIGTRAPDPTRFPLLFKIIDARERLSVQVHPSNATAPLTNGEPKTEMWYVLERKQGGMSNVQVECASGHGFGFSLAETQRRRELNLQSQVLNLKSPIPNPKSQISNLKSQIPNPKSLYAGLREGITPDALRTALDNGTAEQCLVKMRIEAGQSLFIPGGLVHAIGEGCLIYEVQQNSNTTYRLFDWNRTGADGKSRPLHIGESFKVIDWTRQPPRMNAPTVTRTTPNATWADVVSCDYFNVRKLTLSGHETIPLDGTCFHALFVERGNAIVEAGGVSYTLTPGTSCLIPADAQRYTLSPQTGPATLLLTTL